MAQASFKGFLRDVGGRVVSLEPAWALQCMSPGIVCPRHQALWWDRKAISYAGCPTWYTKGP